MHTLLSIICAAYASQLHMHVLFWKAADLRYKYLAQLARQYLCVSTTSVPLAML